MDQLEKNSIAQFTKWAKNYDRSINSYAFKLTNSKITTILNPKPGSSILDVGCGSGILIKKLLSLNRNLKLQGIDITPKMAEVARSKFKHNSSVKITLGSVVKMPFKDSSFDHVTCASSFHHHPDPVLSIKEMVRVLKPGGKLLILDMNIDGFFRKLVFKLENIIHNEGEVYRLTTKEMHDLYQKMGLRQIKQATFLYLALITEGIKK